MPSSTSSNRKRSTVITVGALITIITSELELDFRKPANHDAIFQEVLPVLDLIHGELAPAIGLNRNRAAADIIASAVTRIDAAIDKLEPHSGTGGEASLSEIAGGVVLNIEHLQSVLEPHSGTGDDASLSEIVQGVVSNIEHLQGARTQARADLASAESNKQALRLELNNARTAHAAAESDKKSLQMKLDKARADLAAAESDKEKLQADNDAMRNACDRIREECTREFAAKVEEFCGSLGVPTVQRTLTSTRDFVFNLIADANREKDEAREEMKWGKKHQDDAAKTQEEAREKRAEAMEMVINLQETLNKVQRKRDGLQEDLNRERERTATLQGDLDRLHQKRLDTPQSEPGQVVRLADDFRRIWQAIFDAWNRYYGADSPHFRPAVTRTWQHLRTDIWSTGPPLHSASYVTLPVEKQYDTHIVRADVPAIDSRPKTHDLDVDLATIFRDASMLWDGLRRADCSAHIDAGLRYSSEPPYISPLVIISSKSGRYAALGHEILQTVK